MTKGTLVLIRHGQTDYNAQHRMTGQRDIPLNDTGVAQAGEAGRVISTFVFDKVYSSNLGRAFNTAALALEASGSNTHLQNADGSWNIEQRAEVAELHTGDFTGRVHKTDPEILAFKRAFDAPLPGGESDQQVVARVRKFFEEELQPRLARGETVLVVSHSGTMQAFNIALGITAAPTADIIAPRTRIANATPTVVEYTDGVMTGHYQIENPKELEAANQNKPPKAPKFSSGK
ncbi:MAG: histidine phosphatase family protein [Micavibrio sp.]|nr:histidine phosphatase family protein [Micavibrio sp.]